MFFIHWLFLYSHLNAQSSRPCLCQPTPTLHHSVCLSATHPSPPVESVLPSTILPMCKKVKASSYIAQYPVLRTAQSALHFTSLTDLFTQKPSRLLWEASSYMLQLMREGCSYTYPPLSIARDSFIQLTELEQCRVKKHSHGLLTTRKRPAHPDTGGRFRPVEQVS